MVRICDGDLYKSDSQIIYNPVSIKNDSKFSLRVKLLYPKVYKKYTDMIFNEMVPLGEVQLVQVRQHTKQCVLNSFVYHSDGQIHRLAFVKSLVELCNIASEYHLSVGIEYGIMQDRLWDWNIVKMIIDEVFSDTDVDVRIYRNKGQRKG